MSRSQLTTSVRIGWNSSPSAETTNSNSVLRVIQSAGKAHSAAAKIFATNGQQRTSRVLHIDM